MRPAATGANASNSYMTDQGLVAEGGPDHTRGPCLFDMERNGLDEVDR